MISHVTRSCNSLCRDPDTGLYPPSDAPDPRDADWEPRCRRAGIGAGAPWLDDDGEPNMGGKDNEE